MGPAFDSNDIQLINRLVAENESLHQENQQLKSSVARLELFNKILEKEIADLKAMKPGIVDPHPPEETSKRSVSIPLSYVLIAAFICLAGYFVLQATARKNNTFEANMTTPAPPAILDSTTRNGSAQIPGTSKPVAQKVRTVNGAQAKGPAQEQTDIKTNEATIPLSINNKDADAKPVTRYKVRNKAFFHNEPDIFTRRTAFIIHWNNAILTPRKETEDFIYVVFKNHLGETSDGWLRKDALIAVN